MGVESGKRFYKVVQQRLIEKLEGLCRLCEKLQGVESHGREKEPKGKEAMWERQWPYIVVVREIVFLSFEAFVEGKRMSLSGYL